MRRLDALTDEHRALMRPHAEEWIERSLDCSPVDRERVESGIRRCYEAAGLRWHGNVVWVPNPLVCAYAGPLAADLLGGGAVNEAVHGTVHGTVSRAVDGAVEEVVSRAVDEAVSRAVDGAVDEAVGGAVREAVRRAVSGAVTVNRAVSRAVDGAVHEAVHGTVRGAMNGAVDGAVDGAVRRAVGGAVNGTVDYGWYCYIGGQLWSGYFRGSAHLSFFRRIGLDLDCWHLLDAWEDANLAGWWWPHAHFTVVTDRPLAIRREQVAPMGWGSHRLHSESGPAIAWKGWQLYFWHGLQVEADPGKPDEWLTPEKITNERNAEVRRALMEIYGQGRYMAEVGAELLDEVKDPPFPGLASAKLWRLPHDPEPLMCVDVRNSTQEPDGTYKRYSLWVHPELRPLHADGTLGEPQELTAHNAIASTFGRRGADYLPAVES